MEQLVLVRKAMAGSVSGGYTWPEDGAVIEIPYRVALELVAIRDGGFSVVDPGPEPAAAEITEPAPAARAQVTEPAPKRGGRGRTPVRE